MIAMNRAYQRGMTLTGLIFGGAFLVLVAVLGMKVVPEVIEYGKILKNVKAVAQDPALKQATAAEIRKAFDRRANVDQIEAITAQDIQVSRGGNSVVLSFSYRKEIRLGGPVALVIDFEGSSEQ